MRDDLEAGARLALTVLAQQREVRVEPRDERRGEHVGDVARLGVVGRQPREQLLRPALEVRVLERCVWLLEEGPEVRLEAREGRSAEEDLHIID